MGEKTKKYKKVFSLLTENEYLCIRFFKLDRS